MSGVVLLVRLASHLSCHTFSYTEVRELQLLSKLSKGSVSVMLDSQVSAKFTEAHQTECVEATIAAKSRRSQATEQMGVGWRRRRKMRRQG